MQRIGIILLLLVGLNGSWDIIGKKCAWMSVRNTTCLNKSKTEPCWLLSRLYRWIFRGSLDVVQVFEKAKFRLKYLMFTQS